MLVSSQLEVSITSPTFVALHLVSEIANALPEGQFTIIILVFIQKQAFTVSSRLVIVSVSCILIYVPTVMYGLRLFIVVLQELQYLPHCLLESSDL